MTPGRRAGWAVGLVGGAVMAVLPAHAAAAGADGDPLVLSADGSAWAPDITTPLLDPDLVWVPGDVATGTLYARNVSDENATGVVTVHLDGGPDGTDDALVDELNVRTRMGSAPWTDGTTSVVADLPPGGELPIGIEVELDPAATNASQLRTAPLDVIVTLSAVGSDDGGGVDRGDGPGDGEPGSLPRTGANLLLPALLAAGAIVVGALLRKGAHHE